MAAHVYCDDCKVELCEQYGAFVFPDTPAAKVLDDHNDKVHGGKGFEYSTMKD